MKILGKLMMALMNAIKSTSMTGDELSGFIEDLRKLAMSMLSLMKRPP